MWWWNDYSTGCIWQTEMWQREVEMKAELKSLIPFEKSNKNKVEVYMEKYLLGIIKRVPNHENYVIKKRKIKEYEKEAGFGKEGLTIFYVDKNGEFAPRFIRGGYVWLCDVFFDDWGVIEMTGADINDNIILTLHDMEFIVDFIRTFNDDMTNTINQALQYDHEQRAYWESEQDYM